MAEGRLHWENRNLTSAENLKLATARKPTWLYWSCFPISTKANGFPPWYIPNISWTPWWVAEHRASEKYTVFMASSNKKIKWNLSESDLKNEAADFPRFTVTKSLEEVYLIKFLPFLIEKVIKTKAALKNVKKTRNRNFVVKVDNRRPVENILKMKIFLTTKC